VLTREIPKLLSTFDPNGILRYVFCVDMLSYVHWKCRSVNKENFCFSFAWDRELLWSSLSGSPSYWKIFDIFGSKRTEDLLNFPFPCRGENIFDHPNLSSSAKTKSVVLWFIEVKPIDKLVYNKILNSGILLPCIPNLQFSLNRSDKVEWVFQWKLDLSDILFRKITER